MMPTAIKLVALVSIVAISITGSISSPATGSGQSLCHMDFNMLETIILCSSVAQPIFQRYHYDTERDTCTQTYACSMSFSETHSTMEECTAACIEEDTEVTPSPVNDCPKLPQPSNTNVIRSCQDSYCTVYYSCERGYELFPTENVGRRFYCRNEVWEKHTVLCAGVNLHVYVDGVKIEDSITDIESGKEVTLSCEVTGDVTLDDYTVTWSSNNHIQAASNDLKIASIAKENEGSYTCSVSGTITKQLSRRLRVFERKAPEIIAFDASVIEGRTLKGACVCHGYPKPSSQWTVNEQIYSDDRAPQNIQYNYNVLKVEDLEPGTHTVSCQCNNSLGSAASELLQLTVLETARSRRSIENLTSKTLASLCEQNHKTATVTGRVLRQTRSIFHLKIDTVLNNKGNNGILLQDGIIRVGANGQRLAKNEKYTLKIEKRESGYLLIDAFPSVAGIGAVLKSSCT